MLYKASYVLAPLGSHIKNVFIVDFCNENFLLSEEIFANFENYIYVSMTRCMPIIAKMCASLIYANGSQIMKFAL